MPIASADKEIPIVHPVSLRVIYHDEKVYPGVGGNVTQGKSTYTFKNMLPIPIKLAFPPIGYVCGSSIPITPNCNDTKQMPRFCQSAQVIELKPFEQRRFESEYTMSAGTLRRPPTERFVFGCPAGSREKNIVVDMIQSVGEFQESKP